MMTGIQERAMHFVEQMEELYFAQRDIKGLLEQMCPSTSWLGTGAHEVSKNISDARQALEKEFNEYAGSFRILEQDLSVSQLSDTVCVVYGNLRAMPESNLVEEQNLHLTVICVETEKGMKLAHCNVSVPDCLLQENHYYVEPMVRVNNEALRETLEVREDKLRNLMKSIPGGVHQCLNDEELSLISISHSFLEMFGYTEKELEEKFDYKFSNMIHPDDRDAVLHTIHKQLAHGSDVELEYRVLCKDREPLWVLDKGRLLKENGEESFYCVLVEISQRKEQQEALRLSLERHRIIMDQAADIIFEWDIAADTLEFSQNWRKKFGFDPTKHHISHLIPRSSNIHHDDMPAFIQIMQNTAAGTPYSETEFRIKDLSGKFCWNRIRATAQFDENGHAIKAVGVITDIEAEKKERIALMDLAQRDALTGLYNKSAVKAQIEQKITCALDGEKQALFIIDIDEFKQVNDTYGHFCGDMLLTNLADTLKQLFRSSDLIGRIGGDEFLVYLPAVGSKEAVTEKANAVIKALRMVRPTPELPSITCSMGVAMFPCADSNYLKLYQNADSALYCQKKKGKNGVCFYDPSI